MNDRTSTNSHFSLAIDLWSSCGGEIQNWSPICHCGEMIVLRTACTLSTNDEDVDEVVDERHVMIVGQRTKINNLET
ncbi:hypothetical protein CR513_27021, partial [Mucuna pruriens]